MEQKDFIKGTKIRRAIDVQEVIEWTCPIKSCQCANSNDLESCGGIEECQGCGRYIKIK